MNEDTVSQALHRVVPDRKVPASVLAGARRRRRRTRNVTSAAVLALVAAVAIPLGLSIGSGPRDTTTAEVLHGTAVVLHLPLEDTPHAADAATASSRIAWNLMVGDDEVRTSNRAIAPSSLAVTLAMLAEGATGDSLDSLDAAFGLAGDERSGAIGALRQALQEYEDLPESVDADDPPLSPVVHQANRVVILDDAHVEQEFLDRLASYYDTGAERLPAADADADLDAWAKEHTAGLIEESAIEIRPDTRLITQDALLFAARWEHEFGRDDVPLTFTAGSDSTMDISALGETFHVPHATGDRWEAVRLPYDDTLAMDIILPGRGVHPGELDFDTLDASVAALDAADETDINVTMPPSDIASKWNLLQPLQGHGIDLSEMDGIFQDATTGQLAQQVRLTVTARGTVGAALTEAEIAVESAPALVEEMVVDRPFVMRVLDTRTGWPLFVAIVNDPAQVPG